MPIFGVMFSQIMNALTIPLVNQAAKDKVKKEIEFYALMLVIIAVVSFCATTTQKYCFGILGENVTFEVR
jgi:hypothetical protein